MANRTYTRFAAHYGTAILPTRPYKPQDKAKAEAGVLLVERWIMAVLRHLEFFSLAQLNQAIAELLPVLNGRAFQGRSESRRDLFEALDRPALRALPDTVYEYDEWSKAKVNIDYHISIEKRLYSVPNRLVGHTVDIRITATCVEIFECGKRVASHQRYGDTRYSTVNRTARHEWLNQHLFDSIQHAQETATRWIWLYNNERPNTAIGGIPPQQKLAMAA